MLRHCTLRLIAWLTRCHAPAASCRFTSPFQPLVNRLPAYSSRAIELRRKRHAISARIDAVDQVEQPARARRRTGTRSLAIARFPAIGAFNPQATGSQSRADDRVGRGEHGEAGGHRFRVRKVGLRAAEALGDSPTGPIGKTMEELVPPALREISLNGAEECAPAAAPSTPSSPPSCERTPGGLRAVAAAVRETASTWSRSSPRCS